MDPDYKVWGVVMCAHMHTPTHTQPLRKVFHGEIFFHQLEPHPVIVHRLVSDMLQLDSSTHVLIHTLQ